MKQGQSTLIIVMILFAVILVGFLLFYLVRGNIKIIGHAISTEVGLSKKGVTFKENITTSNLDMIKKSSQANNFLKYCIGIAVLLIAITYLIKQVKVGYKK
ncbi:hypothetical protein KAT24_00135 [Candidatus Pacearchaeota archaeon]|nr:hypothetical protein [Candidatus Pacearchaeota archaeon]